MRTQLVKAVLGALVAGFLSACNGGGGPSAGDTGNAIINEINQTINGTAPTSVASNLPAFYSWMSPDILNAWRAGFFGQGTRITVVDDYQTRDTLTANFGTGQVTQRHGDFTRLQASLVAPQATISSIDVSRTTALTLGSGLNILNLSYGLPSALRTASLGAFQQSLADHGSLGRAIVVKSAGNNSVAIDARTASGQFDVMNLALLQGCSDGCSTIFVGALDANGTPTERARIASYSNVAGTNVLAQQRFLTVGVEATELGIGGTSFAAPVVSGYAAILGSKFTTATPTQIANQLLNTARTDTIQNYSPQIHGRGEASLANALAPISLQ